MNSVHLICNVSLAPKTVHIVGAQYVFNERIRMGIVEINLGNWLTVQCLLHILGQTAQGPASSSIPLLPTFRFVLMNKMDDLNLHYRFLNWRRRIREIREVRAFRYQERFKHILVDGDTLR